MAVPILAIDKHQTNPESQTPPVRLSYAAKTGNWPRAPRTFQRHPERHYRPHIELLPVQTAGLTFQIRVHRLHCRDGCGESAYIPKKWEALRTSMPRSGVLQ